MASSYDHICAHCDEPFTSGSPLSKYCSGTCGYHARKVTKRCEECGEEFRGRKSQRFCSKTCSGKARRNRFERECPECGKAFETTPAVDQKYCSYECMGTAYEDKVERVCQNCGDTFEAIPSKIEKGYAKYCGKACKYEARRNQVTLTCHVCHDNFTATRSKAEAGRQYCSKVCVGKAQRRRVSIECQHCSKTFEVRRSLAGQRYCSRECKDAAQQKPVVKECPVCESEFTTMPSDADRRVHCSLECAAEAVRRPHDENGNIRCSSCRRFLPPEEFSVSSTVWDGRTSRCKSCLSNRRHLRRAVTSTAIDPDELQRLRFDVQGDKCTYCGVSLSSDDVTAHLDHLHPVSRDGSHVLENVHYTCASCNSSKGPKTHWEYIGWRFQKRDFPFRLFHPHCPEGLHNTR